MDKILLKNLSFYGYHGVLDEEKKLGQKFILNIKLYLDLTEAGLSDDLSKTVSYAEIYDIVKIHVENKKYNLLEALGQNICNDLLESYSNIKKIKIEIKKPEAPVRGIFDYMGVIITRMRR